MGYVGSKLMQSLCLTRHGESLAEDVAGEINRLYPIDRAVGFSVGELRGVFWMEFPAAEQGS